MNNQKPCPSCADELAAAKARVTELESENKVLKDIDAHRQPQLEAVQQDFYRERDRRLKLEEALKPFSREAAEWGKQARDDDFVRVCAQSDEKPIDAEFTVGDLRRAAALLKEKE